MAEKIAADRSLPKLPAAPWGEPPTQVLAALEAPLEGLSSAEVARRQALHGPNRLRTVSPLSAWRILLGQFLNLVTALLVAAAIAAFAFDELIEGGAVLVVIFVNAAIGFVTERRAHRSMDALRTLGVATTTVRRGGAVATVPADTLVPGDIVILEAGDILTADLRLLTGSRLQADESPLTGESLPVRKSPDAVDPSSALSERAAMLYKGTALNRGSGEGVVVATGMRTELGAISQLVEHAEGEVTPLERRLSALARKLILFTLLIAIAVAVAAVLSGRPLVLAIEMAIALAVAAIPEGLPIVATVALARGMWRMARKNALVEQLAAVETLGSTTVILTDKTGTLTENRMTVVDLLLPDGEVQVGGTGLESEGAFTRDGAACPHDTPGLRSLLEIGTFCNNSTFDRETATATGDPTEVALLVAAAKGGIERASLLSRAPEVREIAFDPDTKRMATLHREGERTFAAVKGAPESIIPLCTGIATNDGDRPLDAAERESWLARVDALGRKGERTLLFATGEVEDAEHWAFEELTLVGAVGMVDPPRASVRPALEECRKAGIEVVMVTGDHGATGRAIAEAVGLVSPADPGPPFIDARALPPFDQLDADGRRELLAARVIGRATPEQKLDLIALHQDSGAVVAMTGDGVNDAPALKKADIGIAMGLRGTQVAREAADMVLRDDEFGSIVSAVAQGRAIFANIRKFVVYLMSCNVSEVLVVAGSALIPGPLAILPLQILFLNLVTDVFPALALGVCEGSPTLMRDPPRDPRSAILETHHWRAILATAALIAVSVLGAFLWTASHVSGETESRLPTTVAFLTLALAQLWHVFAMRAPRAHPIVNEVTRNRWVWGALLLCLGLLVAAIEVPLLATALDIEDPGVWGWSVALAASAIPFFGVQAVLWFGGRRKAPQR